MREMLSIRPQSPIPIAFYHAAGAGRFQRAMEHVLRGRLYFLGAVIYCRTLRILVTVLGVVTSSDDQRADGSPLSVAVIAKELSMVNRLVRCCYMDVLEAV